MMHYHGTPITPRSVLHELSGRNFCVSFAAPHQVKVCHEIGQSVMLDNGAYTLWRKGWNAAGEWEWWNKWREWVEPWLDYRTTWVVLPDVISGDEEENEKLLRKYGTLTGGVPVWHLHETLAHLQGLVWRFGRVCFGSSGAYSAVGSETWRRRVSDAFDAIVEPAGRVPWVHMLRGMSLVGSEFPFASVDSTDIARNHNRPQNGARAMAERWDSIQQPARWERREQLVLEKSLSGEGN